MFPIQGRDGLNACALAAGLVVNVYRGRCEPSVAYGIGVVAEEDILYNRKARARRSVSVVNAGSGSAAIRRNPEFS